MADLTDEQIVELCKAAGINWCPPASFDDGDFPGMFDMATMDEMRKLLAADAVVADARGLSSEAWSAVTKRCFDTGGNFACAEVSTSRCTVCPNREPAAGAGEDGRG